MRKSRRRNSMGYKYSEGIGYTEMVTESWRSVFLYIFFLFII